MDFDTLLLQAENINGQVDEVLLAVYYFDLVSDDGPASRIDIKNLLSESRATVPEDNISPYLYRLDNGRNRVTKGSDGYRLTRDGIQYVQGLLPDEIDTDQREGNFIETDIANEHEFYQPLIADINKCYRAGVNDAVLVLTRKLLENLIHDLLYEEFGGQNVRMYFDPDTGQHHGFKTLISNFQNNLDEYKKYSPDIDKDIISDLERFKHGGDASAHSILVGVSDSEITELSDNATSVVVRLFDLYQRMI